MVLKLKNSAFRRLVQFYAFCGRSIFCIALVAPNARFGVKIQAGLYLDRAKREDELILDRVLS